jgi:hypothetical protein
MSQCKPGMYPSGALCYTNCSNPYNGKTYTGGFTGNTGVCWQNCTGQTTDTAATCTKKSYENSSGVITPTACPSGKELYGGVCYNACPSGYKRSSLCGCSPTSPNRYTWGSVGCTGPKNQPTTFLGLTTGWNDCYPWYDPWISTTFCSGNASPSCTSGYYSNGAGLCYKNCASGYNGVGSICWGSCPSDMTDFGVGCTKNTYVPSPVGGEMPYGSCSYPVSSITSSTRYTPTDIQDLALNSVYSGAASTGKGCVPNITGTQPGSGNNWATAKGFTWNTDEFDFALGDKCNLCSTCYGSECTGLYAISGVRPSVKRKAYAGNAVNCCVSGANLDGSNTCDPKYRSTTAGRVDDGCASVMDTYCDDPTNYSKTQYCKDNYTQIPYATKDLSSFDPTCSATCGGGTQSRTCQISQNSGASVKAYRKSVLSKTFMSDREYPASDREYPASDREYPASDREYLDSNPANDAEYYIYKDECQGQPLVQECNTQNCIIYELETNTYLQLFLFVIFVFILGYWLKSPRSSPADKVGGLSNDELSPFMDFTL